MSAGTIIFDFDGTIADSFGIILAIFNEISGREHVSDAEVARLKKLSLIKAAEEVAIPKWRVPYLLFRGRKMMSRRIGDVTPFLDIPSVIRRLHEMGYRLCILSSNSTRNVETFLDENKLSEYFTSVDGGIGLFGKARAVKRIMKRHHVQPKDCIYIGDEVRDVEASKRAGVSSIAAAWGFNAAEILAAHHPDALAQAPSELPALIDKLCSS